MQVKVKLKITWCLPEPIIPLLIYIWVCSTLGLLWIDMNILIRVSYCTHRCIFVGYKLRIAGLLSSMCLAFLLLVVVQFYFTFYQQLWEFWLPNIWIRYFYLWKKLGKIIKSIPECIYKALSGGIANGGSIFFPISYNLVSFSVVPYTSSKT